MRTLVVHNYAEDFSLSELEDTEYVSSVVGGIPKCLFDIAKEVESKIQHDEIIVVDQFLYAVDEGFRWLQDNAGIGLIKFLRIFGIDNHVILVTPFTQTELIAVSPSNLIVASRGISTIPYIFSLENLAPSDLEKRVEQKFDEIQGLKPYLLVEFEMPEDERHNWANWWGIRKLIDVHTAVFPEERNLLTGGASGLRYPIRLENKMKALQSQQALWLYGRDVNIAKAIDSEEVARIERKISALEKDIYALKGRAMVRNRKNPNQDQWADFIKDRESLIEEFGTDSTWRKETLPMVEEQIQTATESLRAGLREIEKKENQREEFTADLYRLAEGESDIEEGLRTEIYKCVKDLRDASPRVLYVDDQSEEGWSDIFRLMLFGSTDESDCFKSISPGRNDNLEELCKHVVEMTGSFRPQVIMLDLRLFREEGVSSKVETLSGTAVLEAIKKRFPGKAVLMTTASNKSYVLGGLTSMGADGFWSKEGIDQKCSDVDSLNNYVRLVKTLREMVRKKFGFMNRFANDINTLKDIDGRWWLNPQWPNERIDTLRQNLNVKPHEVYSILEEGFLIYRDWVQREFNIVVSDREYFGENENGWFYPSLVIQHLSKVVECIHGMSYDSRIGTDHVINIRQDEQARMLLRSRGESSHYDQVTKIDVGFKYLEEFWTRLFNYLKEQPDFG